MAGDESGGGGDTDGWMKPLAGSQAAHEEGADDEAR